MRAVVVLLLGVSWPALAQVTAPPPAPATPGTPEADSQAADFDEANEIVVVGGRSVPVGSVIGDIKPEIVLDARDIRSYGAGNLAELLQELAPLTGSIQGRGGEQPVVLLGGRRISGFREIAELPPEAVIRIDILPEEVALKYGYRADQKVVNFVLRRRFNAITTELEPQFATEGGRQTYEAEGNYLRLANGRRISIDGEYQHSNPLFETERDLIDPDPDRTLLAASDQVQLGGTYNRTVLGNISATLNASLDAQNSRSALGLARDGSERLRRDSRTLNSSLRYALNGDLAKWHWSLDGGYVRDWSNTLTDRDLIGGIGRDRSKSVAETYDSEATANGELFHLPAGAVTTTLKAGFNLRDIASSSNRAGLVNAVDLSRDQFDGQGNFDVPVLRNSAIGRLSLNANAEVEHLSDFGTLTSLGYGFNWEPISDVRLIGSVLARRCGAQHPAARQSGAGHAQCPRVRSGQRRDRRHHSRRWRQSGPARQPAAAAQARPYGEADQGHRSHPARRFHRHPHRQSHGQLPDRDAGDRGGVSGSLPARCRRHLAPHRQPPGQFRAQHAAAIALGLQLDGDAGSATADRTRRQAADPGGDPAAPRRIHRRRPRPRRRRRARCRRRYARRPRRGR